MVFYFDIIFLSAFNFIVSRRFLIYNPVSLIIEKNTINILYISFMQFFYLSLETICNSFILNLKYY